MADWYWDGSKWVGTDSRYASQSDVVPTTYMNTWNSNSGFGKPPTNIAVGSNYYTGIANEAAAVGGLYSGAQTALGQVPGALADPYWARKLIQSGQWRKEDTGNGGFRVYNQYGQYVGMHNPNDPYGSSFSNAGDWQGRGMPVGAPELLGNPKTWDREYQERSLGLQGQGLENALYGMNLSAGTSRYIADQSNATQLQTTSMNNRNAMEIAQLGDATRRLELEATRLRDERNYYIQNGQLELARQTEARIAQNEQQRIGLETRRVALEERVAAANMAANPTDWVKNAFFLRGQPTPDGMLGLPSPGAQGLFDQRTAMAAAAPGGGGGGPVGAPAVDTTAENRATMNGTALGFDPNSLPWLRGVRGEQSLASFNPTAGGSPTTIGATLPGASQVNYTNVAKLMPSELAMYQGLIRAGGQSPEDYFETMRRAAPLGAPRTAQRWL